MPPATASQHPRPSRQRPAFRRLLAGLVAAFLVGLVAAAAPLAAQAHTELTSSTPAADARLAEPPSQIVLEFSEKVSARFTTMTLAIDGADPVRLDSKVDGTTVTAEAPDRPAGGRWTIAYRIGSADGHPVTGSITFSVAAAAPPPTPSATAATRATPSPSQTSPAPSTSSAAATPSSTPAPVTEPARNPWWRWPVIALVVLTLIAASAAAAFHGRGAASPTDPPVRPHDRT